MTVNSSIMQAQLDQEVLDDLREGLKKGDSLVVPDVWTCKGRGKASKYAHSVMLEEVHKLENNLPAPIELLFRPIWLERGRPKQYGGFFHAVYDSSDSWAGVHENVPSLPIGQYLEENNGKVLYNSGPLFMGLRNWRTVCVFTEGRNAKKYEEFPPELMLLQHSKVVAVSYADRSPLVTGSESNTRAFILCDGKLRNFRELFPLVNAGFYYFINTCRYPTGYTEELDNVRQTENNVFINGAGTLTVRLRVIKNIVTKRGILGNEQKLQLIDVVIARSKKFDQGRF